MRFRFPIIVLAAISLLTILSLRHLWAANREVWAINDGAPRSPVLIELFTSEGCSDCPPADALLERLDRSQPVNGADLIVLSEHVDYWNDIGWRDPYSSHEYSERQGAYADHFGLKSVYTPQMVVDGRFELVGSDERRAILAIESATESKKIPVSLSSIRLPDSNAIALHVKADRLPLSVAAHSADVLIATADDSDESRVSRGENAGRTLKHVAVLRSLTRVGTVDQTKGFSRDVTLNMNQGNPGNLRIIALVQETKAGRVWGVGWARLSR